MILTETVYFPQLFIPIPAGTEAVVHMRSSLIFLY